MRKTVENNLREYSDQYDCSDEDDYFEGSIKHIAKIGKVKAASRQSDIQKTENYTEYIPVVPHYLIDNYVSIYHVRYDI